MGLSVFLIGIVILAGLFFLISFCIAWRLTAMRVKPRGAQRRSFEQVRREQHDLDGFDYTPYDREPREEFVIPSGDIAIAGEFVPAKNPPPGRPKCIIRVHGFTQNRMISVRFLGAFQSLGYSTVIYDQRCFGNSTGKICSFGWFEREDLSAVIDWVKKRLGEDTFIAVHGESMGAITCLLALETEQRIDCVVADCGASNFYRAAEAMLRNLYHLPGFPILPMAEGLMRRYGFSFKKIDVLDRVSKSDKPILFIHGTADREIPCSMSEEMYRQAKNPLSRLEIFEGAAHAYSYEKDPVRYNRVVQDFVMAAEKAR
ncbi:MAG: alpha/beta hydrolase [Spirochaetaceae bacterium]|jgi:pimeloyl-ACP methyl ester carboxylesterase|nr:alpha/beta hydrolase [Spirochaetaceae bacterium]